MPIQPIFRCAIFFICFFPFCGQQKDISTENDDLYARALSASIEEMEKSWGSIDDSCCSSRIRTDYRHLIVEKDEITESLPKQFGTHEMEYLDSQELKDRY